MSAKYFCDVCSTEMKPADCRRIALTVGRISVEVLTAVDGTWNGGQVCHECVRAIIASSKPA